MDVRHEFWIEERTGAVWAVELRGHDVLACCGPLLPADVDDDLLDTYEYSTGGVPWVEANAEHFATYLPSLPYIPPT